MAIFGASIPETARPYGTASLAPLSAGLGGKKARPIMDLLGDPAEEGASASQLPFAVQQGLEQQRQGAAIQSPLQAAQTEQIQLNTRQQQNPDTKSTPYGKISPGAYDQYILQQASQESEGKRSGQLRAEQESDRRAQQQAQEALMTLSANQRQAELRLQESLMAEREGRRKEAIPELLASVPGLDESKYETGAIDEGEEAADQAAFTSARERAGSTSLSAVRALREMMAGQGLHGSSVEAAGMGNVIGDARGTVGEVARTQALRRSQRAGQRADRDVNSKLTRRSQDISRQQALQQLILGSIY